MNDASPKAERVTLSRDFGEFLVELSIALHKHAMYPSSHPSLGPAAASVALRADRLLEDRATLAFGVARQQLIIEGVATDPNQPVLRRLAEGLHRHHLGAISLTRGVQPEEIGSALRALAAVPEREGPIGLAPAHQRPEWPHVRLHPLTFDQLELISDAQVDGGSAGATGGRGAELWIGLARAAMATDRPGPAAEKISPEPAIVARAIDQHHGEAAYDQVIVGYLLQIASELKSASGAESAALRRRTARLIGALHPDTLRRLVQMGGDAAQRRSFMFDATNGMAVDAVLDILKAAADAEGQTISHGMVRMLSKLAVHAELGQEHVRPLADRALREQVERLLSGWEIEDPNPGAYRKVLHHLASRSSASTVRGSAPQSVDEDDLRIVKMSLEVGEFGPLVDRTIDRVINNGGIGRVRQLLGSSPTGSEKAAKKLIARLRSPMSIACLVARMPFDVETLDELFPEIPVESYEVLLDALITSENRSTRRKLLDRLPRTALDVGGLIVARLDDERWYVQRNLLVLLQRLGRTPAGFSPMRWTEHPDARVRHEAIQLQLTLPGQRDLAVRASLQDVDSRIVRLGLLAVPHECSSELTPLVLNAVLNPKIVEEVRVIAAHALGRSRDRRALDALLNLVDGGRTLRGKPRLAPATPLCLAALRALSDGWTKHPQSSAMLALASGSSDPEVRKAATGPIVQ